VRIEVTALLYCDLVANAFSGTDSPVVFGGPAETIYCRDNWNTLKSDLDKVQDDKAAADP